VNLGVAQENVEDKALETSGSSEAHGGRSFSDIHGDFWEVPIFFSSAAAHDKRLNPTFRGIAVYNLGIISGINEMLLKMYFFGPGSNYMDKPENKVEYHAIMLRLNMLYESYRTAKKLNVADLIENLEQIVTDLLDFSRKIMEESKAGMR
jgi:hypothetical protein